MKEMFNGSAAFSSLGVEGRREGSRNSEEIALMVFWQVCMDAYQSGQCRGGIFVLVPTGSDTMFSYGHHTITVPLPQSMSALREVSHTPT